MTFNQFLRQMSIKAAMAHKSICLQVGAQAKYKSRTQALAMVYDEVARKSWAECAYNGVAGFQVEQTACVLDEAMLRQAETEYDRNRKTGQENSHNKPWNKHGGWSSNRFLNHVLNCSLTFAFILNFH